MPKNTLINNTQYTHTMKTTEQLNHMYDTILELGLATVGELELVTCISGFNEQAMDNIVYVREGYQTLDQFVEYLNDQDQY